LGGRCREHVEVCWVAFLRGEVSVQEELDSLEAEVRERLSQGFGAFKFKVGTDHQRDLERIRLFRAIAGPDTYLRVDASGVWEEAEAIAKVTDMSAAGINGCETPTVAVNRGLANDHPERIEASADEAARSLARVRGEVSVDIIEHVSDLGDVLCAALAAHRAVDVINVIPSQGGGPPARPAARAHSPNRRHPRAVGQYHRTGTRHGRLSAPGRRLTQHLRLLRPRQPRPAR